MGVSIRGEEMSNKPRICIVLDQWELDSFMPDPVLQELKEISSDIHFGVASELKESGTLEDWLIEKNPDVLMSAWMTPTLPEDVMEKVPNLKYVCHLVGSIKNCIPDSLIQKGLLVSNWGHSVSRTVAEAGLMMTLAGLRRVSQWAIRMHKEGAWKVRTNVQSGSLFGRKVGLHGFGAISQELRKLLVPFGVPVMTFSPSVPDSLLTEFDVSRADSLEQLFSENDVIVELAALTPKNRGIVTGELLRSIPKGGVFVNVGRGAVVDEVALAEVAREGHIQVALDVYGEEPLPEDSAFRANDNILLMPHTGGPTPDRRQDATLHGIENLRRFLKGEALVSQITVEVSSRIS